MSFTYSDLKTSVQNRLHNKLGRITDVRAAINDGVRAASKTPFKTMRRTYTSPIRLLDGVYDYTAPSDVMGRKIIDLQPYLQNRGRKYAWHNCHEEAFDRLRASGKMVLTVLTDGNRRILRAGMEGNDNKITLSGMDSLTSGGTWAAVGTASNLELDSTTYLYGTASIKFDLGAGTQDGIDVTLDSAVDIDKYVADGSIYVAASFPSVSAVDGVTVQVGSDSSNYVECTATSDIGGNSLVAGWNEFALKISDGTETGTPDYENIDYVSLLVDKDATTLTGCRFDQVFVGVGTQHRLRYQSRFPWQTSSGTWQQASTADTDILNAEEEEYQIVVEACIIECAMAAREYQDADYASKRLQEMKFEYRRNNPDTSIALESDDWKFTSH